jgi:exodeoxyribonuclease V alpha subunit
VIAVDGTTEITIAGSCLRGLQPGETIHATGRDSAGSRYIGTIRVSDCERILPATVHAMRCYLGSGLIRGIGPKLADAIVRQFDDDTLTVIDTTPRKLLDVHLIGPGRLTTITTSWAEQRTIREVMIFLQGAGVSPTLAVRIHKTSAPTHCASCRRSPTGSSTKSTASGSARSVMPDSAPDSTRSFTPYCWHQPRTARMSALSPTAMQDGERSGRD